MTLSKAFLLPLALITLALPAPAQSKPKLTLDEFFNYVSYPAIALSPDGHSVVIVTERPDWDQQIFRHDLWLYRDLAGNPSQESALIPLTQSGQDSDPKWSPDSRWIAFLSERKPNSEKDPDSDEDSSDKSRHKNQPKNEDRDRDKNERDKNDDKTGVAQIYLISPNGGEAIPLTQGSEEVHSFSWSADSRTIYFSTRIPWTKAQKDDYRKQWKDVIQYRASERGDTIFSLDVAAALARHTAVSAQDSSDPGKDSDTTPGARPLATLPLRVDELVTSPDGAHLAFITSAINQREEKLQDYEIFELNVAQPSAGRTLGSVSADTIPAPRQLTHNQAQEQNLHWSSDSRHIFFTVEVGDVAGPYRDLQPHLYWLDSQTQTVDQWSRDFPGQIESYGRNGNGVVVTARLGTEVQTYLSGSKPSESLKKSAGSPGSYESISTGDRTQRVAYIYSSLTTPAEVYVAEAPNQLDHARPITSFNHLFAERDLPQGHPYRWKADDGTTIEGMLIYPPGSFEPGSSEPGGSEPGKPRPKNLPLFTFIHGGPADADGNHFAADWYQWSALAATNGWLVFEPNYRGSTGYGDKFLQQIVPQIVSRPGKDILEGIDALVKDGIADPTHLTVGGYSYGGYMTNWLITQTSRFKAAVTGAGAVEHVGNWGNDDTTFDDAYFLGGRPWEAPQRYQDEAAIFQIDKVKTPTHLVAGADDIRVAVLEDYLLEHALYSLNIPNALLIFPGEGHSLAKNPWHGKIKVREELKWLQKYGGVPSAN
jgi:dipeptidyl aminopeptidase/acylaminoacyl peptidase